MNGQRRSLHLVVPPARHLRLVTGSAVRRVIPDVVVVDMRLVRKRRDDRRVLTAVNERMADFTDELEAAGVDVRLIRAAITEGCWPPDGAA